MTKEILPNSDAKIRILRTIYKNPDMNFSSLVSKSKTSPNIVLKYVNQLVKNNVLKEKRLGGKKKTHIRLLRPNFTGLGIDIFSMVEIEDKNRFLRMYRELNPIVKQVEDILSSTKTRFCLIYGSFARFTAEEDSDLDVWMTGNIDAKTKSRIREIFSTLGREYTITIEDGKKFLKNINDPIHQNIIKDHIIIYGEKNFLKIMAKLFV
jgi:predicted nucleotidyltransferase/predicted transcriptional regulator